MSGMVIDAFQYLTSKDGRHLAKVRAARAWFTWARPIPLFKPRRPFLKLVQLRSVTK